MDNLTVQSNESLPECPDKLGNSDLLSIGDEYFFDALPEENLVTKEKGLDGGCHGNMSDSNIINKTVDFSSEPTADSEPLSNSQDLNEIKSLEEDLRNTMKKNFLSRQNSQQDTDDKNESSSTFSHEMDSVMEEKKELQTPDLGVMDSPSENPSSPRSQYSEDSNYNEDGSKFSGSKKQGKTQRKGKVSKNLNRRDTLQKATTRGLTFILKQILMAEIKKENKKRRINLFNHPTDLYEFLYKFLVNDWNLKDGDFKEIYPIVIYLLKKTKAVEFTKSIAPELVTITYANSVKGMIDAFFAFNHPAKGSSSKRDYAFAHSVVKLGRTFYLQDLHGAKEIFWKRLLGRKNMSVDNEANYKALRESIMAEIDHQSLFEY